MKRKSELECYLYYMWNAFNDYTCNRIFGNDLGNHIFDKWEVCIQRCRMDGAPAALFADLDDECRQKLTEAAVAYYNK